MVRTMVVASGMVRQINTLVGRMKVNAGNGNFLFGIIGILGPFFHLLT
jgi:hypothetical protein